MKSCHIYLLGSNCFAKLWEQYLHIVGQPKENWMNLLNFILSIYNFEDKETTMKFVKLMSKYFLWRALHSL